MLLSNISEVCWKFYQNGRPSATSQNLRQADILQMCYMALGSAIRKQFFETPPEDRLDLIGGMLDIKEYELSDMNGVGMRRANITDEVLRLPKASDITNVYPVAGEDGCPSVGQSLTPVKPGEENFYATPEFSDFPFFVQKGKGINTYHLPACVKKIQVERIFIDKNMDVPLDLAMEIASMVLGVSLKMPQFLPSTDNPQDGSKTQLREQLEAQNAKV